MAAPMTSPSTDPNEAGEVPATGSLHVPGTNVIYAVTGGNRQILIPRPSDDVEDPLNWAPAWKYLVLAIQAVYTFVTVESPLSLAPMYPLLAEEWGLDQVQLNLLTGVCVLALGYANFVIVPYSNIFGRRQASLSFAMLVIVTEIWEALATSFPSFLAARVLNGVATATAESLLVQVINDMFFLHERGLWTGVYFTSYFSGLFLGPIMAGNIAAHHGWRSFFWLSVALSVFNLVTMIFFPETQYRRSPKHVEVNLAASTVSKNDPRFAAGITEAERPSRGPPLGHGRPSMKQFRLWQRPDHRWKTLLWKDVVAPLRIFHYPIIFWAGLNVAGPANLLLFWNLTESEVFAAAPYGWSPSTVGYGNFAFFVGGGLGLFTAGPFSDWIARRAARKNGGVREAEMRLPALIPFFVTTLVAIVVGGIGYQRQWAWPIILVFGYGLTGLSVTTVPTIAVAYAVDAYEHMAGEIMVVATVLKNTCGFGMSYWVQPLAAKHGYIAPAMVEFALTMGPLLLGLPIYLFGKRIRLWTKSSSVHQLAA